MEYVKTIPSLIEALYDSISGPAGQERKWDQMRGLFSPGARLIRTTVEESGTPRALVMDVEAYIDNTSGLFQEHGFYEWEVARRTDRFGNIAHVLSTYETRHHREELEPFQRGVNSIQLFHDGERWWIVNMIWDNEREDNPMPQKFLSSAE